MKTMQTKHFNQFHFNLVDLLNKFHFVAVQTDTVSEAASLRQNCSIQKTNMRDRERERERELKSIEEEKQKVHSHFFLYFPWARKNNGTISISI